MKTMLWKENYKRFVLLSLKKLLKFKFKLTIIRLDYIITGIFFTLKIKILNYPGVRLPPASLTHMRYHSCYPLTCLYQTKSTFKYTLFLTPEWFSQKALSFGLTCIGASVSINTVTMVEQICSALTLMLSQGYLLSLKRLKPHEENSRIHFHTQR